MQTNCQQQAGIQLCIETTHWLTRAMIPGSHVPYVTLAGSNPINPMQGCATHNPKQHEKLCSSPPQQHRSARSGPARPPQHHSAAAAGLALVAETPAATRPCCCSLSPHHPMRNAQSSAQRRHTAVDASACALAGAVGRRGRDIKPAPIVIFIAIGTCHAQVTADVGGDEGFCVGGAAKLGT